MDSLQGLYRPDTYTIGFTENRYSSMDEENYRYSSMDEENLSPSPDHLNHYFTSALGYAERTNKGAENIFLGKSLSLDRERHKSVGKINTGILDLVFLNRIYKEGRRGCESQLSNCSSTSLTSLTSEPTSKLQQQTRRDQEGTLPDIHINKKKLHEKKKKCKDRHKNKYQDAFQDMQKSTEYDNRKIIQKRNEKKNMFDTLPQMRGVVTQAINQARSENMRDETRIDTNKQNDPDIKKPIVETSEKQAVDAPEHGKWYFITERLVEANKLVREGAVDLDRYNGRYHTPGFNQAKKRLSFCQSSYSERSERERINNIRRRHVSQARTGPLDFNILKRQITTGRSKSFIL